MKADQSLDCVGLYCPLPIVKTAEIIKQMKTGQVLEVVADDKGIKLDMPARCEATGHECLGIEEDEAGKEIKLYVKKAHE